MSKTTLCLASPTGVKALSVDSMGAQGFSLPNNQSLASSMNSDIESLLRKNVDICDMI